MFIIAKIFGMVIISCGQMEAALRLSLSFYVITRRTIMEVNFALRSLVLWLIEYRVSIVTQ